MEGAAPEAEPDVEPDLARVAETPGVRGVDASLLVAACIEEDMLGVFPELELALTFPPCFDWIVTEGLAEEADVESRPNPDRLPRSCGVINAAKFSAPVAPLRRRMRCTEPVVAVAVRKEVACPGVLLALSRCQ